MPGLMLRARLFSISPRKRFKRSRGGSFWRFMVYSLIYLKVCEGCGSLWLRPQNAATVYCLSCEKKFRSFSRPVKRRPGRPRMHTLHVVKGGAE